MGSSKGEFPKRLLPQKLASPKGWVLLVGSPKDCPYNSIHFLQILCELSHCWIRKKQKMGDLFIIGGGGVFIDRGKRLPQNHHKPTPAFTIPCLQVSSNVKLERATAGRFLKNTRFIHFLGVQGAKNRKLVGSRQAREAASISGSGYQPLSQTITRRSGPRLVRRTCDFRRRSLVFFELLGTRSLRVGQTRGYGPNIGFMGYPLPEQTVAC